VAAFVRFWGTRGSIPTPGHGTRRYGGNTSCVEIRFDDTLFICDGGTGLRELGLALLTRKSEGVEAHMFFSHMHWDHIQGFPFFVPAYAPLINLHV
jgi:phosphoribosyl 1,2-cyclic phosphodiesterase